MSSDQDMATAATTEDVLDALDAAHAALMCAAEAMASRYGRGTLKAVELCGAALMISEDWIPSIRAEITQ